MLLYLRRRTFGGELGGPRLELSNGDGWTQVGCASLKADGSWRVLPSWSSNGVFTSEPPRPGSSWRPNKCFLSIGTGLMVMSKSSRADAGGMRPKTGSRTSVSHVLCTGEDRHPLAHHWPIMFTIPDSVVLNAHQTARPCSQGWWLYGKRNCVAMRGRPIQISTQQRNGTVGLLRPKTEIARPMGWRENPVVSPKAKCVKIPSTPPL